MESVSSCVGLCVSICSTTKQVDQESVSLCDMLIKRNTWIMGEGVSEKPEFSWGAPGYSTLFWNEQTPPALSCLCLSSDWTLGSPLNSVSYTSPPRKINRQTGCWKEKEGSGIWNEQKKEKKKEQTDRQTTLNGTGEEMLWTQIICVFTLSSLKPPARWSAMCPGSSQEKSAGDSAPHPTQTMADTTLIPTQSWMLKTLHTRVFTKKTARDCRYIGVKYHTAWSPTTQAPDMRLSAELWDPKACVRSCTFRRTLCIHEQKIKIKNAEGEATYTNNSFFKSTYKNLHTLCGLWLTTDPK